MAHRYFGEEMGDTYVDSSDDQALKFTMTPQPLVDGRLLEARVIRRRRSRW